MAVTVGFVIVIDDAVIVQVAVLDVAGCYGCSRIGYTGFQLVAFGAAHRVYSDVEIIGCIEPISDVEERSPQ